MAANNNIKTWQKSYSEAIAKLKANGEEITPKKSDSIRRQALMDENENLRCALDEFSRHKDTAEGAPVPKVAALPPIDPDYNGDLTETAVIRDSRGFYRVATYDHCYGGWRYNGPALEGKIVEWWPLPEPGTGTPTPRSKP